MEDETAVDPGWLQAGWPPVSSWVGSSDSFCDTINQTVNTPDSPQISAMLALSYKNVNKFAYLYQTEDVTRPG